MRRRLSIMDAGRAPDRGIFAILTLLMFWLPWPWGSKPEAAASLLGLVTALLVAWRAVLVLRGHATSELPLAARMALGLWALWLAWLALELIPLPPGLLASISPSAAAAHAAVAEAGGRPLYTISLMPGASVDQWLLSAAYFCLFWLVLVTVRHNRPRQRLLLNIVALAGVAQALYGIAMTLSGFEYGFFAPKTEGLGVATGTFVNRNHLAGYLEVALAAGIALVLADLRPSTATDWRERFGEILELALSPRMRIRVMLAIMVIALVLTRSRMGNVAFFASVATCGSVYVLLRHPRYFGKSLIFLLSLFAVDMMIVSQQYGLKKVAERIESTDLGTEQRTLVLRDLLPLVREFGIMGAGAGSFGAAFSPHRSDDLSGYYDHAHNDHLEFVIETGAIGYGILALLGTLTLVHGLLVIRRRRDPMACALGFAGIMALVSLSIHGLADFNLRIPAVAATMVALMALTLSCSSRSRRVTTSADVSEPAHS